MRSKTTKSRSFLSIRNIAILRPMCPAPMMALGWSYCWRSLLKDLIPLTVMNLDTCSCGYMFLWTEPVFCTKRISSGATDSLKASLSATSWTKVPVMHEKVCVSPVDRIFNVTEIQDLLASIAPPGRLPSLCKRGSGGRSRIPLKPEVAKHSSHVVDGTGTSTANGLSGSCLRCCAHSGSKFCEDMNGQEGKLSTGQGEQPT
mmetsp:Transcript_90174/g.280746  ORF Transcript_90174/g.280746 Transcript_90174/m.280746 type:complete len:202 (+) Transcript_90174:83-688(+)